MPLPPPLDLQKVLVATEPAHNWLVEDVFPSGMLMVLGGLSGTGKSLVSFTLAYCAALGLPFVGHETMAGRVLYLDQENSEEDRDVYLRQVWRGLGCPDMAHAPLFFYSFVLAKGWEQNMHTLAKRHHPDIIFVDTAATAFNTKDENDNSEAALQITALRGMQAESTKPLTVVVLKHQGEIKKGTPRTLRGAKTWIGATDRVYYLVPNGNLRDDGLRPTKIIPAKPRALGLRVPLLINPQWTSMLTDPNRGIVLRSTDYETEDAKKREQNRARQKRYRERHGTAGMEECPEPREET